MIPLLLRPPTPDFRLLPREPGGCTSPALHERLDPLRGAAVGVAGQQLGGEPLPLVFGLNRQDVGPVHAGGLEFFRPHVMPQRRMADPMQILRQTTHKSLDRRTTFRPCGAPRRRSARTSAHACGPGAPQRCGRPSSKACDLLSPPEPRSGWFPHPSNSAPKLIMTPLRQRTIDDMTRHGLSARPAQRMPHTSPNPSKAPPTTSISLPRSKGNLEGDRRREALALLRRQSTGGVGRLNVDTFW